MTGEKLLGDLAELPDTPPGEVRRLRGDAIERYRRALDLEPRKPLALQNWSAELIRLAHLDPETSAARLEEALELLERRVEILREPVESAYNYACVLAQLGRKSEALASLQLVLAERDASPERVRIDPDWAHWLGDPELEALLGRFEER